MIAVIERMDSVIYCPNELIVREGAPGKAIYLINQGRVRVIKGGQQVAVLSDHQFFGEQSIITEAVTNATVRAITYCDMSILMREKFQQASRCATPQPTQSPPPVLMCAPRPYTEGEATLPRAARGD